MTITDERLRESYRQIRHKSGLTLLLYPMRGYSSSYALFGTKFGSIDNRFSLNGETVDVPDGTAHFLEHKMFESEAGDAFDLFAKTGASANAFTSFDRTCYLFSTTDRFAESLESLLRFVSTPYFTAETVAKEQGIIGQEIRMYDDNPEWRVFFNLLTALYQKHPIHTDIAGTVESIAEIDPQILYKIYSAFYNLNNMVLAVAGNFEPETVVEIADKVLTPAAEISLKRIPTEEPPEIQRAYVSQRLEVSVPLFSIGFKESPDEGAALIQNEVMSEMLLEILAGEGSPLYRTLYDAGLINSAFGTEVMTARGCFAELLEGESKDPEAVFAQLKTAVERLKATGVDAEEFERVKKLVYGRGVRQFNHVDSVANLLVGAYFYGASAYDSLRAVAAVTPEALNRYLKTAFSLDRCALSVILPKQG